MCKNATFDNLELYKNCTPSGVPAAGVVKCIGKAATISAKHNLSLVKKKANYMQQ
jgi:hypothetical protein